MVGSSANPLSRLSGHGTLSDMQEHTMRQLRKELGLSQRAFGAELGIVHKEICLIENYRRKLSLARVVEMLDRWPTEIRALGGLEWFVRGATRG